MYIKRICDLHFNGRKCIEHWPAVVGLIDIRRLLFVFQTHIPKSLSK